METALKQSLLLTHGTIYGDIAEYLPFIDCIPDVNPTAVRSASVTEWRAGQMQPESRQEILMGTMTDNAPIDFHHWTMVGGIGESGLEWWQQCMTLFMRHV